MILVTESCWMMLTNSFQLIGPEIVFYCQKNTLAQNNEYFPDIDPIKVKLRFFDRNCAPMMIASQVTNTDMYDNVAF